VGEFVGEVALVVGRSTLVGRGIAGVGGQLGCRREETVIVGDRMDTDIIAGLESEIETVLVLSGVTRREDLHRFAYRPRYVLDGVGDIVP